MTTDLQARLRDRAKRMNGALVGASDGGTYTLGYYDQFAAADDKEAADRLDALSARIQELEAALEPLANLQANVVGEIQRPSVEAVRRARSALGRNAG